MKVYRVYKHFHFTGESGAYEYGIFSSRDKAVERLKEIYKKSKKENPIYIFEFRPEEGYLVIYDKWEKWVVKIQEFELDEKMH